MRSKKLSKGVIFFLILFVSCRSFLFAAENTTAEKYQEGEFPQWAMDLRRTEIITFGSLPLVTLGTSLAYGGILFASGAVSEFPNPFSKDSSAALSSDQQMQVFFISLGTSLLLGIIDYVINLIRRSSSQSRIQRIQQEQNHVTVTPIFPQEMSEIVDMQEEFESESLPEVQANVDETESKEEAEASVH